jgi:hypothetical protein
VSKVAPLEEMYLIYQAVRNYLADSEPWGEFGAEDLVASYYSFCQREPIGGVFLESVWKGCQYVSKTFLFETLTLSPSFLRRSG